MGFGKGKNTAPSVEKAPKIKKEKLRNTTKVKRNSGIVAVLIVAILACAGVYGLSVLNAGQDVEVVTLISSVPQDGIIAEENLAKKTLSAKDFLSFGSITVSNGQVKSTIVKWENRNEIINKYASYYIKSGTPVYYESIGTESGKQYSYLYSMDGELLKVSLNANTFGQMLVPGDHINVRASYTDTLNTLPTYDEFYLQQQMGITSQNTVERQILLFNNVAILDMLNSNGESIFDLYYEILTLPKEQQIEMINSEEFIKAVEPAEILLNVTPEEADRYMSIQAKGPTYMMTLLPRTSSNAITELLNELQTGFARIDKDK